MDNKKETKCFKKTISDLTQSEKTYLIPIYQRNYAWGYDEINQLLDDLVNAYESNPEKNYYIGSLVTYPRGDSFEVIDGQQRLTTIKLLLLAMKSEQMLSLSFEHRKESNDTLNELEKNGLDKCSHNTLTIGFKIIEDKLSLDKFKNISKEFYEFIHSKVIILQTEMPEDTDLNHYFERMNNRGKQLEKHEILKANLMAKLGEKDRSVFSQIWETCSDMSRYAITLLPVEFKKSNYDKLPLNLDVLNISDNLMKTNKESILSILEEGETKQEKKKDEENEGDDRYNSVIDFPNFLLHVLKIFTQKDEISLNDKDLLSQFDCQKLDEERVKEFSLCLLRIRLLFDRYVIKLDNNEEEKERWGLKKIKYEKQRNYVVNTFSSASSGKKDNRSIVHLLAMFQSSFRSKIYKDWLYDVLFYLYSLHSNKDTYEISDSNSEVYLNQLECFAKQYVKDRYSSDDDYKVLNDGTRVEHYIFNYLDYLIWKNDDVKINEKVLMRENFYFSQSSNSIEHHLAQNHSGELKGSDIDENNFGNLCLISRYQNSSLSDDPVKSKKEHYISGRLICSSLKQASMFSYDHWGEEEIKEHRKKMIELLKNELSSAI